MSQSQRSRFQLADDDDASEEEEEGNGLKEEEAVLPVDDVDLVINQTSTTEDTLATTEADINNNNNNTLERTADPSVPETTPSTVASVVHPAVTPTQDPRLTYDDSEWKPLFVNTRATLTGSQITTTTTTTTTTTQSTHQNSPTLAPTHEDGGDYEEEEDEGHQHHQEETTDLPPDVKQDRIIDVGTAGEDKTGGEEEEITSPVTPTKFSFLQWFNAQLNNVKLAQKQTANNNNSTSALALSPLPSSSTSTRFFTLKPTAVSYTGVQPILRPKPWVDNATESAEAIPAPPAAGFVMGSLNRTAINEAAGAFLPRPFQVQTTLNLAKEPGRLLVESPRSQKSLPLLDSDHFRMPITRTTPRDLASDRQQQVELLKDFFPPVRRPSARPQVSSKIGNNQRDNLPGSLPIEGLFTSTLKPAGGGGGGQDDGARHRSNTNSPIYTFKLNQGQSVHDVLSQLLADLTVGDSPAQVEIDGSAPSLTLAQQQQQQQQQQNNDMKNKASNKKVDDDRTKPWAHMPFRPAILNALYHNTRGQNLSGANVEVSIPTTTTTTATPVVVLGNEDVTTEMGTNNSSSQHPLDIWPHTDSPTGTFLKIPPIYTLI